MSETDSESKTKDDVYRDRNLLALAFIRAYAFYEKDMMGDDWTVERGWWPDTDDVNGEEWAVVWVNTEFGQVGWHIPKDMVPAWLPKLDPDYDGYTTDEKNARLAEFAELSGWDDE